MEIEVSLLCTQGATSGPSPEPHEFGSHLLPCGLLPSDLQIYHTCYMFHRLIIFDLIVILLSGGNYTF